MLSCGDCPVHCRMLSGLPSLYTLDTSSTPPQVVTIKIPRQYDSTYVKYLESSKSWRQKVKWWLSGARRGKRAVSVSWVQFQFCKMKRVLRMDSSDGCTPIWMCLVPLNYTHDMVQMTNFMLGALPQFLKMGKKKCLQILPMYPGKQNRPWLRTSILAVAQHIELYNMCKNMGLGLSPAFCY